MIHYHGTPLTPKSSLMTMGGRNFCVPFSDPRDAADCLSIGQIVMFDNGAFSSFTRGRAFDEVGYYRWLEGHLGAPHWGVVPDVIGGSEEQQREMVSRWPFPRCRGAPVWHLNLPIDYLIELTDTWPMVCFGSSGLYWKVGSDSWSRRADEAFNALAKRNKIIPHIHMLRGLSLCGKRWPFASADSTNIARNFKDTGADPDQMSKRIDSVQCGTRWSENHIQQEFSV